MANSCKSLFAVCVILWCSSAITYTKSQGIILQALYLGDQATAGNGTNDDCIWKRGNDRDQCPDDDINVILYTDATRNPEVLDTRAADWLRNSHWNSNKENIILVHGYAGGDNTLPMVVLRDAYLKHGDYNVFVADWGKLGQPPCYVAAVHNIKPVARCLALSFEFLRNSGLRVDTTTCVGHSLGAHICGLMANYLSFRIERIIALDPARPLIRPGLPNRLDSGDAKAVQVLHTNAGHYGEGGQIGHVDFCVNGGKRQPYCDETLNANLCSHIWAICYLSQSIFEEEQQYAEPCLRRCPPGPSKQRMSKRIFQNKRNYIGNAIPMGQHTPLNAFGSYCFKDTEAPFCPKTEGAIGDKRCCIETLD